MIAEQTVALASGDGAVLDARLLVPPGAGTGIAICHPHPLYGGDMNNPVVRAAAEACAAEGLATLRFNFRGVGASTGSHDAGRAEQRDLGAALDHLAGLLGGDAAVAAAGYSFGAMVTAAVAPTRPDLRGVALIAPPLAVAAVRLDGLTSVSGSLLIVAGGHDDYCPPERLTALARDLPRAEVRVIDGGDHVFTETLAPLREIVRAWARGLRTGDTIGRGRAG
jgi:hypothetical protein